MVQEIIKAYFREGSILTKIMTTKKVSEYLKLTKSPSANTPPGKDPGHSDRKILEI